MSVGAEHMWVVRELSGPIDAGAAASKLAELSGEWCWLDGTSPAPGEPAVSYLGAADELRVAVPGKEQAFLDQLQREISHAPGCATRGGCGAGCFGGGWVVALGYEFGLALIGVDPPADDVAPGFAIRLGVVLAVDHDTGRAELRGVSAEAIDEWLARFGAVVDGEPPVLRTRDNAVQQTTETPASDTRWRHTPTEYLAHIEACRASIRDGDAYVLCLTDTAETPTRSDPLALFQRLREDGVAVRGGIIVAGDRALVSMSPERFLSVHGTSDGSRTVATHPIKGTRRRGRNPHEDQTLIDQLLHDPKERAENLMIVDLMRNDLSRVCDPGSVGVNGFLRVETHPHVHQLVSTVSGRMSEGSEVCDVIRAAFPGGSMTGAPKHSAAEILASRERHPRGLYAGCFGWIGTDGAAELAMTIRGIELRGISAGANQPPSRAFVGAGAGLTADSEPGTELAETRLKAAPLLAALDELRWRYP